MTGSFQTAADNSTVSVIFTGPVSTADIQVPEAHLKVTLKPGLDPVTWPGPTGIATEIAGLGPQNCTAVAGNPAIQTTSIVGGVTPTTATTKAPTTTKPPAGASPVKATPQFTG